MDRIITSSRDRTSLLSTHKVLRNTYFMLSLTLAFSAITATASTVLMLPSPGLILTLVGMYGLMFLTYKTANKPTGIISAFAFTGFLGYILGPILNTYLSAGMGDVIAMALGGTALVFFCCSAYVLTTRKDMSFLGGMLMAGIVVVLCFVIEADQIAFETEAAAVEVPAPAEIAPAVVAASPALKAVPKETAAPARGEKPAARSSESTSIRVAVEKVDQLINLVGELVITQSMLAQRSNELDPVTHGDLITSMGQLQRNARDLQESVMSIRMMPMEYVFSRFPRLVRDLASKLNKQIELTLMGSSTELDKSLIERIIDPLTHLVRNSLDHGIELPENRVAAGKSPVGNLILSAEHQGGNICIEVTDDGAGLNRERILAKAISQGMAVNENMTDEEVGMLIFAPGFSTAEQVTDVSGRGVGMDVVKRNIQEMGGHVEIQSKQGAGTTIRILLPLTLAILDGMSVKVADEVFILPLNAVMESLQPREEDLHPLAGGERVLEVRGEYLPLVELWKVFEVDGAKTEATQGIVVILQSAGRRYALLVDQLIGQHQVVVKNLESNYRKVPGISAATILGDGSVALIVDVSALQGLNREQRVANTAA